MLVLLSPVRSVYLKDHSAPATPSTCLTPGGTGHVGMAKNATNNGVDPPPIFDPADDIFLDAQFYTVASVPVSPLPSPGSLANMFAYQDVHYYDYPFDPNGAVQESPVDVQPAPPPISVPPTLTPPRPEQTQSEPPSSESSGYDASPVRRKPCSNWTPDEDAALTRVVGSLGTRNWKHIAEMVHRECPTLPPRTADQCSQHWLRVLDPTIVKGKWTREDDKALIEAVRACPPRQWKMIADRVQGRTDIQVRYRMKRLAKMLLKKNILPREKLPLGPDPRKM